MAKRPFEKIVVGPRPFVTMGALHSNSPVLVKLHGTFDDPQDRVITLDEYNDGYGSIEPADKTPPAQPTLYTLLNQIFGQRPLLFLGCSLQQDRTMSVLESTVLLRQGVSHYAVLERPKDDDHFQARKKFLGDRNIRCIWYPNGEHGNLGLLLAALAKNVPIPVSRRDKESALNLTFSDVCEPEKSAVDELLASTDNDKAGIVWHRKIADVIDQLKDWKANFDIRVQIFAWVETPDQRDNQIAFRSQIINDYDTFVRTEQLLVAGLHTMLRHTARASYEDRNVALRSYAGLAALKMMRCLWTFQRRVWNAQTIPGYNPEPPIKEFTFLPKAQFLSLGAFSGIDGEYLIPPFCSFPPIAALALPHLDRTYEQFLVCRLRDGNGLKNPNLSHGFTIVLPQTLALRLFRTPGDRVAMKKAYYSRILPAWLAMTNRPGIPSLRSLRIFLIQGKDNCDFNGC